MDAVAIILTGRAFSWSKGLQNFLNWSVFHCKKPPIFIWENSNCIIGLQWVEQSTHHCIRQPPSDCIETHYVCWQMTCAHSNKTWTGPWHWQLKCYCGSNSKCYCRLNDFCTSFTVHVLNSVAVRLFIGNLAFNS